MTHPSRRRLLQAAGTLPAVTLAGCAGVFDSSEAATATPEYERLPRTAVYTADDVGLRLPERVERVTAPTNADLVVLHGAPDVDGERAVNWLADERAVALLGDSAQSTWLDWADTDAYRDAFGSEGRSAADPAPHLLVAAASGTDVSTHRYSWSEQPSNADLLRALDDAMAEIAAERAE